MVDRHPTRLNILQIRPAGPGETAEMLQSTLRTIQSGPILHPFLFAIHPILFLWSSNIGELSHYTSAADLLLPMVISLIVTLFLLALLWIILRDWKKVALLVSFSLVLFFSYGYIKEFISDSGIFGDAKNRYMVSIWATTSVLGGLLLLRYGSKLRGLTNPLNFVAFVLVVLTFPNFVSHKPISDFPLPEDTTNFAFDSIQQQQVEAQPDIYYITTEGYNSARNLKKFLDYDNSEFVNYLERNGFYVASDSNSNHNWTTASLAASLNMEIYDHITVDDFDGLHPRDGFYRLLFDNKVMRLLRARGYRIVYLRERFSPKGKLSSRDLYYGCEKVGRVALHSEEFAGALLHFTALQPVLSEFAFLESTKLGLRRCDFSQLAKSKHLEGPKMVFIHLRGPGKEFLSGTNSLITYRGQLTFTNQGLRQVVDSLLFDRDYSPVIIIQGDHGEGAFFGDPQSHATRDDVIPGRMGILNAYHLPRGGNSLLYPSISPVNSFRVIFNYYFGTDYELLDDRSIYSDLLEDNIMEYFEVTDVVRQATDD